jgi:hypothetical protein
MSVRVTVEKIEQAAANQGLRVVLSPAHEREVMRRLEDGFTVDQIVHEVTRSWPPGGPSGGLLMHRLRNISSGRPVAPQPTPTPPSLNELDQLRALRDAVPPTLEYLEARARLGRSA